ncbi:MAG TPA: hypothetical protein VLA24_14535 [Pseudomonadales bacterium]|nr:hypothetical protein [Pseudomonadales bacterium]
MFSKEEYGYNGWTNWDTWNVALWIDNDEPTYRYRRRYCGAGAWNATRAESFCREVFPNGTPDMDTPAEQSMESVDWQEIADNWNADE